MIGFPTPDKVVIYDSTLRDGTQREGVALTVEDKLRIVTRLDALGIDYIEGGFPASNPKDVEFFSRVQKLDLSHARIAAFGMTCRKGCAADADAGLRSIIESGVTVATIVGKSWDEQVTRALDTELDENLRMVRDSISFLKQHLDRVIFDAEHFFDGYKANPEYALQVLAAAVEGGADSLDLCETNGGALPHEVRSIVAAVVGAFPDAMIGIHTHNDSGCAVANSLAAVEVGARQVQGTINGYGERVGNADLTTIIPNLELKMGYQTIGGEKIKGLCATAQLVADIFNLPLAAQHPYVGASAFAHKGGLHASAIARFPSAYEHIDPELVGNHARVVVSELAGRASLVSKAAELGFDLDAATASRVLNEVKEHENRGYSYEAADASLALLIQTDLGEAPTYFRLESFRVISEHRADGSTNTEATIKIHVGGERLVTTAEGNGPVNALDTALRKSVGRFYPELEGLELTDFRVRVLETSSGTDAITHVLIQTSDGAGRTWGTIGVDENIIEASWEALVESLVYGLSVKEVPTKE